jgi:hypothetical protein
MVFSAPKGKLDPNDKLFKLITSTIRPEPEWQQWSNGVIASLYRAQAKEEAIQGETINAHSNNARPAQVLHLDRSPFQGPLVKFNT